MMVGRRNRLPVVQRLRSMKNLPAAALRSRKNLPAAALRSRKNLPAAAPRRKKPRMIRLPVGVRFPLRKKLKLPAAPRPRLVGVRQRQKKKCRNPNRRLMNQSRKRLKLPAAPRCQTRLAVRWNRQRAAPPLPKSLPAARKRKPRKKISCRRMTVTQCPRRQKTPVLMMTCRRLPGRVEAPASPHA